MITLRQAVELTISAIEEGVSFDHLDNVTAPMLRRALAEPQDPVAYDGWVLREVLFDNGEPVGHRAPEQEPVAWMTHSNDLLPLFHRTERAALMWGAEPTPLYTAPPQRKPLTDEEIEQAYRHIYHKVPDGSYRTTYYWIEQGIRYAEQAHGIKGEV